MSMRSERILSGLRRSSALVVQSPRLILTLLENFGWRLRCILAAPPCAFALPAMSPPEPLCALPSPLSPLCSQQRGAIEVGPHILLDFRSRIRTEDAHAFGGAGQGGQRAAQRWRRCDRR